ncbi:MAG: ABC transporter permease [Candidatus Pacebacteria bacterium]|nr:ABC transporter permease [Candidatus Paceibacterota bacterium]
MISIKHGVKISIDGVWSNKTRSFLTTLGIVIGIASIILIVSIGKGAEQLILTQVEGMGADMLVIRPGQQPTGPSDIADTLFSESLTVGDVKALKKKSNVPDMVSIAPAVMVTGSASYRGETYRPTTFGWSAEFMSDMFNVYPERGVLFGEEEIEQLAHVAVIGAKVEEELFGEDSALGKKIRIKDQNFRVIGIFPEHGQAMFFNIDEVVLIPYSTAQTYLLGIHHYHEVMLRVADSDNIDRAIYDIEMILRDRHNITDPNDDDFFVESQQGVVDQIGTILSVLTLFLSSVVAISLVVGGIGVMNIMLVSVTERTKEIGLRKAIGATNSDIRFQFLLEAIVLTSIGGVLGIVLGVLFSMIASVGLSYALSDSWDFSFPLYAALLSVGVSSIVGLVFGIYPAYKASKKSPIEALRYE